VARVVEVGVKGDGEVTGTSSQCLFHNQAVGRANLEDWKRFYHILPQQQILRECWSQDLTDLLTLPLANTLQLLRVATHQLDLDPRPLKKRAVSHLHSWDIHQDHRVVITLTACALLRPPAVALVVRYQTRRVGYQLTLDEAQSLHNLSTPSNTKPLRVTHHPFLNNTCHQAAATSPVPKSPTLRFDAVRLLQVVPVTLLQPGHRHLILHCAEKARTAMSLPIVQVAAATKKTRAMIWEMACKYLLRRGKLKGKR